MPRALSPAFLAQLTAGAVIPAFFVEIAFENETFYFWTGIGSLNTSSEGPYNPASTFPYGTTFTGVGWLGKISPVPQVSKVQAQNITLMLNGLISTLVTEAIGYVRTTGTATIWFGFLDESGTILPIQDPAQIFYGALDVPSLQDSGEASTIAITAENPLISLNDAPNRRFDDLDQQIYVPGDLGLSFVDTLANMALFWPAPASYGSSLWPVDMIMSPQGADIAVGGIVTISTTVNYSDGSHYTLPAGSGSGPAWIGGIASMNPKVATVDGSGVVTGRSPGIALIVARSVVPGGASPPSSERRVSCSVIVHS